MKHLSSGNVKVNLSYWLANVRKTIDIVDLWKNIFWKLEPQSQPLIDNLREYLSLPSLSKKFSLKPEEFFIKRELFEDPALVVLKEELAKHKLKQKALEAKLDNLVFNQTGMKTQLDNMLQDQTELKTR